MEPLLQKLITENFEKDFFWQKDASRTINNIQNRITTFQIKNPNITADIIKSLKNLSTNALIENWTHFFNNDRCMRFLLQISEQERYVLQVSIFGFFSFYQHSATKTGIEYQYEELRFINRGELAIADKIYDTLTNYLTMNWLNSDVLTEVVSEFSEIEENPFFSHIVTVADVFFTSDNI